MKVLIVGSGGREHALAWKFSQSKRIHGLFVLPGNGGSLGLAKPLGTMETTDHPAIIKAIQEHDIDLVFVGPETPLSEGIVDALEAAGIPTIGPNQKAAQLESSKAFTKALLDKYHIPTAKSKTFTDAKEFSAYIDTCEGWWVVKKSGLAAGKGVLESKNKEELRRFGMSFLPQDAVVVEEFLSGYEVSVFTISDGKDYLVLPPTADYKKAKEGNEGPNTGGMGAISPVPWLSKESFTRIKTELVAPVFEALKKEGLMYKGILYFGIMVCPSGPKILEFNVRFGDPEAQVLIPRIKNDFCTLFESLTKGTLSKVELDIDTRSALGIVLAAEGYPGTIKTNVPVDVRWKNTDPDRILFHAGTKLENKTVFTIGGRCFTAVGLGNDLEHAREGALSVAENVIYTGKQFRRDIGVNLYNS